MATVTVTIPAHTFTYSSHQCGPLCITPPSSGANCTPTEVYTPVSAPLVTTITLPATPCDKWYLTHFDVSLTYDANIDTSVMTWGTPGAGYGIIPLFQGGLDYQFTRNPLTAFKTPFFELQIDGQINPFTGTGNDQTLYRVRSGTTGGDERINLTTPLGSSGTQDSGAFADSVDTSTSIGLNMFVDAGTYDVTIEPLHWFITPQITFLFTGNQSQCPDSCCQGNISATLTVNAATLTFWCDDSTGGGPPAPGAGNDLAVDMLDNVIAVAWVNDDGKIWTSLNRRPEDGIGQAYGSQGFLAPVQIDSGSKNGVGLAYLPNGTLIAGSGSLGKVYQNLIRGGTSAADWVGSGIVVIPTMGRPACRGQEQVFTGGGGGYYDTGTGVVTGHGSGVVQWCRDNRGNTNISWGGSGSIAIDGQGYIVGCWVHTGFILLFTDPSNLHIKWVFSPNPESWVSPAPTDTGLVGQIVSLVRTDSGVLVGLIWDYDSRTVPPPPTGAHTLKAIRSRDNGKTWELDTAAIPQIPALKAPPILVAEHHIVYAVWIEAHSVAVNTNNRPVFAASKDGGVSWV